MFDAIESLPPDPILGVNAAFRRDESPHKIDLGIGVYRDQAGITPVPAAVHEAERAMIAAQTTKTYIGPLGNPEFNERITELALGPLARTLRPRIAAIQTVGGCGALRVGAELLHVSAPETVIHVSTPTWANHEPLVGSSGLALERYPYYDPATRGVDFDRMHSHLARLPAGAVVLLHACCHNPTGADLSPDQWRNIAELVEKRGLLPFVDLAYQGLGTDLEVDVAGPRLIAERVPEMLLAISCSKNFGLYRDRTGALLVCSHDADKLVDVRSQLAWLARNLWSTPPDHGAAVVAQILADPALKSLWVEEVEVMRQRIAQLRIGLVEALAPHGLKERFAHIAEQRGMFSYTGLSPEQVKQLRERHSVYMVGTGRANIAGADAARLEALAAAIADVCR